MTGISGEILRGAAQAERQWNVFLSLDFWWGIACQSYAYWFWIIIAILTGLLISVDMRLHNLLKHIPKKVLKELYKPKKKGLSGPPKKRKRK